LQTKKYLGENENFAETKTIRENGNSSRKPFREQNFFVETKFKFLWKPNHDILGHTDLSEDDDAERSTTSPEPMAEFLQQNVNSSSSGINSRDLQQFVFNNSAAAQEMSIAHAQEEAAWSLVSMGRGNPRNGSNIHNRQMSVSAPMEEVVSLPNSSQSSLIPKVIRTFGFRDGRKLRSFLPSLVPDLHY
jgi:hypothetical protein